jgi:hypothetical protein
MDIDAASMSAISAARIDSQISTRVAVKAMDVVKEQGQAAVALIQAAADVQQSTSSGSDGHSLDVTA